MKSRATAPDHASGRSGVAFLRSQPLLVGRCREQDLLREELAAACGGRGRLVLLGGEAGIGKTTLAQDLAAKVDGQSACVLTGHCYDLTNTPPYGPWLDLFESCRRDSGMPSPPAAFAGGKLDVVTDQAALFADVRRFFAELSAARPALVLLEDFHWADPASLELLRHVAPHLRQWPMLLLVTYRGDELTRRHPLAQQLPALVREAEGLRLDLRRLDADALRFLVASRFDLPVQEESRLVAYLEQHAEGNPFYATELLRALEEDTLLRQSDDGWTLGALDNIHVPTFLRQVIEGRVARLGEAVRQPLAMAAVIGQDVSLVLWAEVADLDDEVVLAIVEEAVEAHLLEAERDGARIHFVHALTREALYEGVLPPRRRLWHRQVAETLMVGACPDPDAVAYHLQQAGDSRAPEWLVQAADRAQRAYAWLTAAERLQAASGLLAGVAGQERTRGRLASRIAYLKRFSDLDGAIEAADEAARVAIRIGDTVLATEAHYRRGLLLCYADHFRSGLAEMDAGEEAFEAMPPEPARIPATIQVWFADALPIVTAVDAAADERAMAQLDAAGPPVWRGARLGRFLASAGHLRVAVDSCGRSIAALATAPGVRVEIRAANAFAGYGLGIALAGLGRPEEACHVFAQARAIFAELDHHALVASTLLDELRDVALTYGAADPARSHQLAAEAEAALGRTGGALRPSVSPHLAGLGCLVLDGNWDDALRILDGLPAPGNAYLRREVTAARAVLARHRGEPETAWEQIRPLFPDGPATAPGDLIHQEGLFLQRLAADLCLDAGDLPGAQAWLEAHDAWLVWSESVLGRADGQVAWARYHWVAGDSDQARVAADDALVCAAMPEQPLVQLAVHRFLGEIETAARDFEAAAAHLEVALDLAGACDAPFERASTLLAMAEMHATMGDVDETASVLDEVRRICVPLRAAPTLARVEALAARLISRPPEAQYPAGLTQREVEVLRLLPRGLSNAEIAAALFVSPRTVQTHLTNLYGKLGVGGRAEAVAFAMAHDLV